MSWQDGRPQLVLLDHGLYRHIDDGFRLQYAGLWHALVFADVDGIAKHARAMGAGGEGGDGGRMVQKALIRTTLTAA
jgi:predicted unusual protein kinase regulating ubiquinone biosynthesis (AarF/ABC1/UbiB family)